MPTTPTDEAPAAIAPSSSAALRPDAATLARIRAFVRNPSLFQTHPADMPNIPFTPPAPNNRAADDVSDTPMRTPSMGPGDSTTG